MLKLFKQKKPNAMYLCPQQEYHAKLFFFGERIFQENRSVYSVFLMKIILNMFHKNIL